MTLLAAGSVALAAAGDRLVAEPPARLHPVAWLGRALGPLDRPWHHPRLAGAVTALVVPLLAAAAVAGVVALAGRIDPLVGAAVAGLARPRGDGSARSPAARRRPSRPRRFEAQPSRAPPRT